MQSFMILKWHQIRSLISILSVIDKYRFIQRTCLIVSHPLGIMITAILLFHLNMIFWLWNNDARRYKSLNIQRNYIITGIQKLNSPYACCNDSQLYHFGAMLDENHWKFTKKAILQRFIPFLNICIWELPTVFALTPKYCAYISLESAYINSIVFGWNGPEIEPMKYVYHTQG